MESKLKWLQNNMDRLAAWVAAIILLQTLYFKFTGHSESVHIFTQLGVEPWGRIGVGILELITAILLSFRKTIHWGGVLAVGLMLGALVSHFFILGVETNNDGGKLFILAVVVLMLALFVFFKNIYRFRSSKPLKSNKMKFQLVFIFSLLLVNFSCKKEEPLEEMPMNDAAVVLYEGSFQSSAHTTKGKVKVESDGSETNVVISGFKTDNGPDLRVYLSKDKTDNDFINLGNLKSTEGDFFYKASEGTDFTEYNHVLIWCEDFSVLFGYAELK